MGSKPLDNVESNLYVDSDAPLDILLDARQSFAACIQGRVWVSDGRVWVSDSREVKSFYDSTFIYTNTRLAQNEAKLASHCRLRH